MSRSHALIAGCLATAVLVTGSCSEQLVLDPEQFSAELSQAGSWPDTLDAGEVALLRVAVRVNQLPVEGARIHWSVDPPSILVADTTTSADSVTVRGARPGPATVTATIQDEALTTRSTSKAIAVRLRGVRIAAPRSDTVLTALGDTVMVRGAGLTNTGDDVDSSGVSLVATGGALETVSQAPDTIWLAAAANGVTHVVASHTLCAGVCVDTVLLTVQQEPASVAVADTTRVNRLQHARAVPVSVLDRNGFAVADAAPSWSRIDGEGVLEIAADGKVTGLANGVGLIRAAVGAEADTSTVVVHQVMATAALPYEIVALNALGLTDTVTVALQDSSGVALARAVAVAWTSSAPGVVSVAGVGSDSTRAVIEALAAGEGYVRADAEGITDSLLVTVTQTVASVEIESGGDTLNAIGHTVDLDATVLDGNAREIPGAVIAWASLDTLVATANQDGVVTARTPGNARITATSGDRADTTTVLVRQVPAAVAVTGSVDSLAAGDTTTFVAAVVDSAAVTIAAPALAWTSSDESVAVVDVVVDDVRFGQVTGASTGTATITATAGDASGSRDIRVTGIVIDAVVIEPDSLYFTALQDTARLSASALNPNGNAIPGVDITWSSTDEAVATVNTEGLVTAVANGATKVVATAEGHADTADVTVAQAAASVELTPATATLTSKVDSVQLTASVTDALGQPVAGAAVIYTTTSGSGVVNPDANGLVISTTTGVDTVVATSGTCADSAVITVGQVVASLAVTPDADTIAVRGSTVLSVAASDSNGYAVASPTVTWVSAFVDTATVSGAGTTATVTGVDGGLTPVVASSDVATDTATITVQEWALDLDGTDDYAHAATGVDLGGRATWTIELWVRPDAASGDEYLMAREAADGQVNLSYAVLLRNGAPLLIVRTGGGPGSEYELQSNAALSTGDWHHVAFTYDASSGGTLYLDGATVTNVSASGSAGQAITKGSATLFGAYGTGAGDGSFDGGLDEVRVWNAVRSATEIANNRTLRLDGSQTDLIAYWPFDAGAGSGQELKGNASAATLNGVTWSQDVPPIH